MENKDSEKQDHSRTEGKRIQEGTVHAVKENQGKIGGEHKFSKDPAFLESRVKYFDELYATQEKKLAEFEKKDIKINLPDGTVKEGKSYETSALDIATGISKQLAEKVVVAHVKYSNRVISLDDGLVNPDDE